MKKKQSRVLNFLNGLLSVIKWIFIIMIILLVLIGIVLAVPDIRKNISYKVDFTNVVESPISDVMVIYGILFIGLFTFIVFLSIIYYLQKIVKRMKNLEFFEKGNLKDIRKILHLIWTLVGIQVIFSALDVIVNAINNHTITINLTSLLISLIFVVVVQTIYILLDNGLKLKQENDSFL